MDTNQGVVLVTGTNGGLGSGLVGYLVESGIHNIACHVRDRSDVIGEEFQRLGLSKEKHLFAAELTDEAKVRKLREDIEDRLGPVAAVVNLAGGSTNGVSWKLSLEEFRKVVDTNLTSTFLVCREFIPGMRERGHGRIVNTSSIVAFSGVAGASHYCAAKAGIVGFSKSLSLELAPKGVTVNVLGLGYFDRGLIDHLPDDMREALQNEIPLKRFGTPAEIGGLVKFLIGDEGGYTTGQVFHLNGGLY